MAKGGSFEKSSCFGAAMIALDSLDLTRHTISWYKLFAQSSNDSGSVDSL